MRYPLVLGTALALVALTTAPAGADSLGQTGSGVACSTAVPAGVLLGSQGAGGATYTAATSGVLTSFSTLANSVDGQVRAVVFGPGPSATQRSVLTRSAKFTVTKSAVNTFAIRLPIGPGQQLGLGYTASGMSCATAGLAGDVTWIDTGFDPDTSATFTRDGVLDISGNQTFRPNISAVLEPDADGDQYVDLTQDACPASALTQAACPAPDTKITKRPKRVRANARVKVKFASTLVGSSFQCNFDGRRWKPCTSPYKKKWRVGTHKLKIRAISPFGIVDGKPAKVKVTITR